MATSGPQYTAKDLTQLMRFYQVNTIFDLIAAQEQQIQRLQKLVEPLGPTLHVREG